MEEMSIFVIEQFILNQQYNEAAQSITGMFIGAREGKHFASTMDANKTDPELTAIYTRFAKCICRLFLDYSNYKMDVTLFTSWLLYARELRAVFTVSGFYRSDFLIKLFDLHFKEAIHQHQSGTDRLPEIEQLILRLLLFSMLENTFRLDFSVFFQFSPLVTQATILSLLSSNVVITPQGAERREQLFDLINLFEHYTIPQAINFVDVYAVWMMCSYALRRDKHVIKKYLNNSIKKWLGQEQIMSTPSCKKYDPTHHQPTLLIVIEYLSADHSMGRSYGRALKSLKNKFNLTALVLRSGEIKDNDPNYAIFDEMIECECYSHGTVIDSEKLSHYVKKILSLQPDLIFYPSLGMHQVSLLLANMRLAPIQMMSFGHPASSFCDTIDYGIIEEDYAPLTEDLHSEKLILLPKESVVSQPLVQIQKFTASVKHSQTTFCIAISSVVAKISAAFLQTLKKISDQSNRPLQFLFFLNETELFYLQCKKDILNSVPNAHILHRLTPESYLTHLDNCDLYLSTFPFGGANSVIDALCVGLPVVCLRGDDIAARTDSALIMRRDLPAWLVAQHEDEYIHAALRLIHNDDERLALSEMILARSIELIPEHNPQYQQHQHCFANACWEIYQQHHTLQTSTKKIFSLADLMNTQ